MAKRKRPDACAIKRALCSAGVDFNEDFHALPRDDVEKILAGARRMGYRKRKGAPGSRARMFFQYLARKRGCR